MDNKEKKERIELILMLLACVAAVIVYFVLTVIEMRFYQEHMPDPRLWFKMPPAAVAAFSAPEEGVCIVIDLDRLTLVVLEDGAQICFYPVSGGKRDTPTPLGTWQITELSDWGGVFGGSWMSLNVPWGKYGIHGTMRPWEVGVRNVSEGCIRMRNSDAEELRGLVSVGTIVHIKHANAPFRTMCTGKSGSDVLELQRMLYDFGYYRGAHDGIFGGALEEAVRSFQRENGLQDDGRAGEETVLKLREAAD